MYPTNLFNAVTNIEAKKTLFYLEYLLYSLTRVVQPRLWESFAKMKDKDAFVYERSGIPQFPPEMGILLGK